MSSGALYVDWGEIKLCRLAGWLVVWIVGWFDTIHLIRDERRLKAVLSNQRCFRVLFEYFYNASMLWDSLMTSRDAVLTLESSTGYRMLNIASIDVCLTASRSRTDLRVRVRSQSARPWRSAVSGRREVRSVSSLIYSHKTKRWRLMSQLTRGGSWIIVTPFSAPASGSTFTHVRAAVYPASCTFNPFIVVTMRVCVFSKRLTDTETPTSTCQFSHASLPENVTEKLICRKWYSTQWIGAEDG